MRVIASQPLYTGWPPITQDTVEFEDGARKQWIDLDGEGIPGVLVASDSAWFYEANRGNTGAR